LPTPDDPIVTANVTSLSATGEVKIKFSTDMNTDIDLNMLRSDYFPYKSTSGRRLEESKAKENYIQIMVQPNDDWDAKSDGDGTRTSWKSWKATSYIKDYLTVAIDFNDPSALSPNRK